MQVLVDLEFVGVSDAAIAIDKLDIAAGVDRAVAQIVDDTVGPEAPALEPGLDIALRRQRLGRVIVGEEIGLEGDGLPARIGALGRRRGSAVLAIGQARRQQGGRQRRAAEQRRPLNVPLGRLQSEHARVPLATPQSLTIPVQTAA